MALLGVNVDHVATVRNARGGTEPDPVAAALEAERAGADSIVCHLREDRRHIRDADLRELRRRVSTSLQLEMALTEDVIGVALDVHPVEIMVVPERRAEVTTEGGFDCIAHAGLLGASIKRFRAAGIAVSVFIDADAAQVAKAQELGAHTIELHTGPYSHAQGTAIEPELARLEAAWRLGKDLGLEVHAGHGLNFQNVQALVRRVPVAKVNIGHSIVSRALFSGLAVAVAEMKRLAAG